MTETKIVYPYDSEGAPMLPLTLDSSDLDPVAAVSGETLWLIPGNCLIEAPPDAPEGKQVRSNGLEWVLVDVPAVVEPEPDPVTATALRSALTVQYELRMSVISAAYPTSERESWPVQTEEARRMLADAQASTPWIDAAAAARGLDRLELAQRIVGKALAYAQISGAMTGARQAIEDHIDAAGNDAELLALIDVTAGWPDD